MWINKSFNKLIYQAIYMTKTEAVELLKFHSGSHDDINNIKYEKGFLGMLKWCSGELYEDNYNEVLAIIDTLKDELQGDLVDRRIIANLMCIYYYAKLWALDEDSMLRRNRLLRDEQVALLNVWVSNILERIIVTLDSIE